MTPSAALRYQLEQDFWRWWWATSLSQWDFIGALLTGPCFFLTIPLLVHCLKVRPMPLLLLALVSVEKLVFCASIRYNPDRYLKWRVPFHVACRFLSTLAVAYVGAQFGQMGGIEPAGDILILSCSLMILFVQPFVCTVPFKIHLISQTISFLVVTVFSVQLCEKCETDPSNQRIFRGIERVLDGFGPAIAALVNIDNEGVEVVSMTRPVHSPCRLVLVFGLLWLGWVLPSLVSYVVERQYRRQFLLDCTALHGVSDTHVAQSFQVSTSTFLWCFNFLAFFEVSWRVLKLLGQEPERASYLFQAVKQMEPADEVKLLNNITSDITL